MFCRKLVELFVSDDLTFVVGDIGLKRVLILGFFLVPCSRSGPRLSQHKKLHQYTIILKAATQARYVLHKASKQSSFLLLKQNG